MVTVIMWTCCVREGDIDRYVYDKLGLMTKFFIRFQVQEPALGLGLGDQKHVWLGKVYGYI